MFCINNATTKQKTFLKTGYFGTSDLVITGVDSIF